MGAWGVKLYENDLAQDIKEQYLNYLREGKTNEEATRELVAEYEDVLLDIDDGPNFWFVLADQQWKLGKLLPCVKKEALNWIEKGADLPIWYKSSEKLGNERKKVLEVLSEKLNSPQPSEKKIYKHRYYTCPWKVGDTFAYKMECELAKKNDLYGMYIILQKVGNRFREEGNGGHTSPIVRCWITDKPVYSDDSNGKTTFVRSSKNPRIDGNYNYAYAITTTSNRVVPKKLIYLGNYKLNVPKDDGGNIEKLHFSLIWRNFEEFIIKDYLICILNKYDSYNDFC